MPRESLAAQMGKLAQKHVKSAELSVTQAMGAAYSF